MTVNYIGLINSLQTKKDTVESRFVELPGKTENGSRNREFEKSGFYCKFPNLSSIEIRKIY